MQFLRRRTKSKEEELVRPYPNRTTNSLPEAGDVATPVCDIHRSLAADTPEGTILHSKSPSWTHPAANTFVRVASHRISSHSDPSEECDDATSNNILVMPPQNSTSEDHSRSYCEWPKSDAVCP